MSDLQPFLHQILCEGEHFLGGLNIQSSSATAFFSSVYEWGKLQQRTLDEMIRGVEPSVRQSIVMSLIPAAALREHFEGSYDRAITEHLSALGLTLGDDEVAVLRSVIINIRRLRGLNSKQAREKCATLALIKSKPVYRDLRARQRDRCLWCGVSFSEPDAFETLEHVIPKHLGDDMPDGRNWALSCKTCNEGKADTFVWSASSWAYDYVRRNDFMEPDIIEREHRWVVLRRTPECAFCKIGTTEAELWVTRRIKTGLAIPSNCSSACAGCAEKHDLQTLPVRWAEEERSREMRRPNMRK